MNSSTSGPVIRLKGVRHNNLKNFDLEVPKNRLVVVTGPSGSGKSSLAFDTLFAEGQRRYIETFSPYARQFFDRMDKPQVDLIEGIPPAIAVEQRNTVRTTRSTVGTMTEICDYVKVLWPHIAVLHCRQCGRIVHKDAPGDVWRILCEEWSTASPPDVLVLFSVPLSSKFSLEDSLDLVARQGYQRLWLDGEVLRLEDAAAKIRAKKQAVITVVQDRLRMTPENRARFAEACEQAFHLGKGRLSVARAGGNGSTSAAVVRQFSSRLHCAECDVEYREPSSALFSFNHPLGACPACHGFGRIISIDYHKAIPNPSKTLAEGVVRPWQSGFSAECQDDLIQFCRKRKIPTDVPFNQLPTEMRQWVVEGDPDYGKDKEHEWPRVWYGVKGYFKWLESKAYKMHVRILLSRYRAYTPCKACGGLRFQPEALDYRATVGGGPTIAGFYQYTIAQAHAFMSEVTRAYTFDKTDPQAVVLDEIRARLSYLLEVGLGYLTLDRPTKTLSGGETERVNLTTCLGARLVNTLYVLDEPSVGLHPRDTSRLVHILERLRDAGNSVVVVEHEASVMRAADHIIDLGPASGERGGQVIFQGTYQEILKCAGSLTGQYLRGSKTMPEVPRRLIKWGSGAWLTLEHATRHNLVDLSLQIPLGCFVTVTGVSGSGKTTLIREVLLPLLEQKFLNGETGGTTDDEDTEGSEEMEEGLASEVAATLKGWEALGRVLLVDQSSLGKTPRSNPVVYVGAFEHLRELFALTDLAKQRGYNASAFSFNSAQGQCERCRGAGFEKIEMQFLSDVFVRCPDCGGRRYRAHILEVTLDDRLLALAQSMGEKGAPSNASIPPWSIGDLLEATVDEVLAVLHHLTGIRPADRAAACLQLLQDVGLGYLRVGQPINTLSGGECQRLKLAAHLAAFSADLTSAKPAMLMFDEPTTGLHFDDVRVLLAVFRRLVEQGHTVLVIEHNVDVIKAADWIIDLGPDAGAEGGRIVVEGPPEVIKACRSSHTGRALA